MKPISPWAGVVVYVVSAICLTVLVAIKVVPAATLLSLITWLIHSPVVAFLTATTTTTTTATPSMLASTTTATKQTQAP